MQTRRSFLAVSSLGLAAAAVRARAADSLPAPASQDPVPGATPAFGTASPAGPAITPETLRSAEKLCRVELSEAHREEAAASWQATMAPLYERRTGPRRIALGDRDTPAAVWNPARTPLGQAAPEAAGEFRPGRYPIKALPASDTEIAYSPVTDLAGWIRERRLTSERLTRIYLQRLQRFQPMLNCVITLTDRHALEQARAADAEIAAGHYRGPLHGIPWGAKDLLDTAGIATTWGAEPFRDRVPKTDAAVTSRLNEAGAVLVAKLSLGALALNDIWFGGQTRNPWLPEEGASGSSAGPAAAVAAGLVGFAIGSETQGSIVSPCMRCGVTGLRPTFGRVPRTGAMTLSWSCDKLGPMARGVEDTGLVLHAISGFDPADDASVAAPLHFDAERRVKGMRVGYIPGWLKEAPATAVDRHALEVLRDLGAVPVPVALPDWPYDSLNVILFAEAAAAFEEITLDGRVDQLRMQVPDAWPNLFRQARFLSAVDLVQADRLRRKVAVAFEQVMQSVDCLLVPSLRDEFLVITNFTGHPSLTLRAGFVEVSEARSDWAPDPKHPLPRFSPPRRVPYGVSLVGRLFDEGTLLSAGMAMERELGVAGERPPGL